ncbi:hypothetical protein CVT24_004026 [Panaeolus cyanescens]|uniref:Beta-catenin-like protein 1 N-terminal domain-containing protein n=1 Tax=Panaeolus cyanescens TaxID=181874 RepID=A0A409Y658_9AGAR|nr:hypothetical protein CVT24_004026 [Panaeolus cyanescens]
MDIDSIFKVPKLPPGVANKRKLPDNPSPELLKRMRLDAESMNVDDSRKTSAVPSRGKGVEMEEVEDEDGHNFAPGGDADYFAEEDDEGRFFGGGLTSEQKEILNIFDSATTDDAELGDFSISKIRKLLLNFERAVNKNQDHRSKYPNDPSKFIDSEADLDSAIKALIPLSQSPALAYSELVRSGAIVLLVGLLTHENIDIVIDVIDLVFEFTDEDAENDLQEDDPEQMHEAIKVLVDGLVNNSALELLVDNLPRFNEEDESDRQGVYRTLGIFENVVAFDPNLAAGLTSKTKIMGWLLKRIQSKHHEENRSYAAELISIFLSTNTECRAQFGVAEGVETLLQVLSQFRRKDPVDAEETEFMDNLFDSLCSALHEVEIKKSFLDAEGTDLMVLIMKEKKMAQTRAIKVLDHALSGPAGESLSTAFVDALGLKTLFSLFLGKTTKKIKAGSEAITPQDTSHILSIISSLFRHLPSDSSSRIRLLAKFVENDYEKVDKVLDIRESALKRLATTDAEIAAEKQDLLDSEGEDAIDELEEMMYLRRLDGGLFTLQTVDYILAWLMVEDDGVQGHITRMLARKDKGLTDIRRTLEYYRDHIDDDESEQESAISQREILGSLIAALSGDTDRS